LYQEYEDYIETKQQIIEILSKNKIVAPLFSPQVPKESDKNLLLSMNRNDELASIALGFKSES